MLTAENIEELRRAWAAKEITIGARIAEHIPELLSLASLAAQMHDFVREYDPERLIIPTGKCNHPSPLCRCGECRSKFDQLGKPGAPVCAQCSHPNCDADSAARCPEVPINE